jgi:glycine oxidase
MRIVVHGAGIFGLSVAWACLERGAQVTVVDPDGPGAGASGGVVGALAPHVPEAWNTKKALQFESLDMAELFWTEVAEASGDDPGYARTGRVQPLADEAARGAGEGAGRHGGGALARPLPVGGPHADDFPNLVHSPPASSPSTLQRTAPSKARGRGAGRGLDPAGGGDRQYRGPDSDAIIHATGVAGLLELKGLAGDRIIGAGVKGQAALLDRDLRDLPQLYADGLHVVPHVDGTVAVGSTSERDWDDPTATDTQLDEVIARARAACPALRDAPGDRTLGRHPAPHPVPRADAGASSPAAGGIHRQWRLQDRLRHGALGGRPHGRPRRDRHRPHPARVSPRGEPT